MAEPSYEEAVTKKDLISELLDKSFAVRPVCEQKDILQHKKPLPRLRVRTGNRIFQGEWYAKKNGFVVLYYSMMCVFIAVLK